MAVVITHTYTISILIISAMLLNASMLHLYVLNFALLALELTYFFLTLRRLMSYIYGAPILHVSRSHTTTQHSR